MTRTNAGISSGDIASIGDVDEAAARWNERLRDHQDHDTRQHFEGWHALSPAHAAAFGRVQVADAFVRAHADAPGLRALRDETRARLAGRRSSCLRRGKGFAIAASLLLCAVIGALALRREASVDLYQSLRDSITDNVYRTGVGERATVTLDDGSVITLNTDSRVSVHYTEAKRSLTLERGQALFKVAHNRARPFVVTADGREVTALGTEFEVRVAARLFEVTLLEGRVTVANSGDGARVDPPPPTAELHPGQQFVAVAARKPHVRSADVKREVSWRHGQAVFEGDRLEDAVAEMNRYSRQQIVLGDSELAALKISGAFNTGDTGTFVDALTTYFPIDHARSGAVVVLKRRAPGRG